MRKKLAHLIKHNSVVQFLYRNIMSALFRFVGIFVKTDDNLVLINSYGGEQYSDSPRVLYEKMLIDERFRKYHFVWAFEYPKKFDESNCPSLHNERTSLVIIDSPAYFIIALKAKVWITNVNIERGLHFKKRNTIYLNTGHGTAPKIGGNMYKGRKDFDFSYIDILCVDGDFEQERMVKMCNADVNKMLRCGRPREDELFEFTTQDTERIKQGLNIPEEKKVILYMPTWREYQNSGLDWVYWQEHLRRDYVVLVRAHHFSKTNIFLDMNSSFWTDVTNYPNVNELYWISDILISDYSSALFDFGLLGRPIISFAKDHDRFMQETGLYMKDWEKRFPNGVMRSDKEVIQFIETMDYQQQSKISKEFVDSIVSHPGNATNACLDRLTLLLQNCEE